MVYFYYKTKNQKEIDFVCRQGAKTKYLIQVCYDITNPKTLKREITALEEASAELNAGSSFIFTWQTQKIIRNNKNSIELQPVWKWLLNFDK